MKFNSQICTTRSQSERLLALGLKKGTADMMYCITASGELITAKDDDYLEHLDFPAWSLHRLIEMMPNRITYPTIYDSTPLRINKKSMYYLHRFFDKNGDEDFSTVGDDDAIGSHNVYDYAVSVIGFLIKEGYFNKEYLEE